MKLLVSREGVVHTPRTTPSGVMFFPPRPVCGDLSDVTPFWGQFLDPMTTTPCRICQSFSNSAKDR